MEKGRKSYFPLFFILFLVLFLYSSSHAAGKDQGSALILNEGPISLPPAERKVKISPKITTIMLGDEVQYQSTDGAGPYSFKIFSGEGAVDRVTGKFTGTSKSLSSGIQVFDLGSGEIDDAFIEVTPPLKFNSSFIATSDKKNCFARFSAEGGIPPYTYFMETEQNKQELPHGAFQIYPSLENKTLLVSDSQGHQIVTHIGIDNIQLPSEKLEGAAPIELDVKPAGGKAPFQFNILSGGGSIDKDTGVLKNAERPKLMIVHTEDAQNNHFVTFINTNLKHVYELDFKPSSISRISLGGRHGCFIRTDQKVECWGDNSLGQRGGGDFVGSAQSNEVVGLPSPALSITSGRNHTCVLLENGRVMCWGDNSYGQLGNGTPGISDPRFSNIPVDVRGMDHNVTSISTGNRHSCGVKAGVVFCWGDNSKWQLGTAFIKSKAYYPTKVERLGNDVTTVVSGSYHTCALIPVGLVCWGANGNGQLGIRHSSEQELATHVPDIITAVERLESKGNYNCALISGDLKCWGFNGAGQLGIGNAINRSMPVSVLNVHGPVSNLAVGYDHNCAMMAGGSISCWGYNFYNQIVIKNQKKHLVLSPEDLDVKIESIVALAAGDDVSCVLTAGDGIKCFGKMSYLRLDSKALGAP